MSIRDGRFAAAAAVAHRAWIGASTFGTDLQAAVYGAARNRAATSAYRNHVGHGHLDGEAAHATFGGQVGSSVVDDCYVGARAAAVESQDALNTRGPMNRPIA